MADMRSNKRNYRAEARSVFPDMRRLLERIRDDEDLHASMSLELSREMRRGAGPRLGGAVLRLSPAVHYLMSLSVALAPRSNGKSALTSNCCSRASASRLQTHAFALPPNWHWRDCGNLKPCFCGAFFPGSSTRVNIRVFRVRGKPCWILSGKNSASVN
jgi:hypothetical protein